MDCQLVIAHRVCPVLSAKAVGFRTILDLVRAGAVSMRKALEGLAAKLVVVLDGCPTEYEHATASAEEVERLVQKHLRPYPAFG